MARIQPSLEAAVLCFKEQHHHQNPQNNVCNVGKLHPNGATMIMNAIKIMFTYLVRIAYTLLGPMFSSETVCSIRK
jgi:hypothetical protein